MKTINLYADLQANPYSKSAYRKLAEHYKSVGMNNEAEAFLELIRRKFDADSANADEEQRGDDKGDV